jgi:ABC-2 type transport system ATP-binding protein
MTASAQRVTSASPVLEAESLVKAYGSLVAIAGVSLRAAAGEIIGLLGPNGAGKTTTVSIIAGLLRPDSGRVVVGGRELRGDTDPAKRLIGLVPQDLALYEELSARDNLSLFASLYGVTGAEAKPRIGEALSLVGLSERAASRVTTFSGGMKRRLNIAAALLHDPQLLLLDEPTVGVDPQSRSAIFDTLETLRDQGKTLLYTTHYMEEAERLCGRLVIIDHGRVVADDTLEGLHNLLPAANLLVVEFAGGCEAFPLAELQLLPPVRTVEASGKSLRIGLREVADAPGVLQWIVDRGYPFQHVSTERASLESVFLTLTGRSLRD